MNLNDCYLSQDVAEIFGVSVNTIYGWKRKGIIVPDFVLPNGKAFYSKDTVDKLFQSMVVRKNNGVV